MFTNELLPGVWVEVKGEWLKLDSRERDKTNPFLWHLTFRSGKRLTCTHNWNWNTKEYHFEQPRILRDKNV